MNILPILKRLKSLTEKNISVQEYLDLTNVWEANFIIHLNNSLNKAQSHLKLALVSLIMMACGVIYMAVTEKHYIQIEEIDVKTGYRKIRDLYEVGKPLPIDQQEVFLKADLTTYINCYEGYTLSMRQENMACVGAFSTRLVTKKYMDYIDKNNELGPASIVKELGKVKVKIIDITPLKLDKKEMNTVIANVVLLPQTDKEYEPIYTNITITYKYKNVPSNPKIRHINPHGLLIDSYFSNPQS